MSWSLAIGLSLLVTTAIAQPFREPSTASMTPQLKHHIVRFPTAELHFSYPTELTPSGEFMMDRMDHRVDDTTVRWMSPNNTAPFVSMHADVRSGLWQQVVVSSSIVMWLGVPPKDLPGDMRNTEDLKKAFLAIPSTKENAVEEKFEDVTIAGRVWVYVPSDHMYITGLTNRVFISLRVDFDYPPEDGAWKEWVGKTNDIVMNSLRLKPVPEPAALTSTAN